MRTVQCVDIVFVYNEKIKRQLWNIGSIIELLSGRDGQVRSAIVRTMDKSKKPVTLIHPLKKFIPLKVATESVKVTRLDTMTPARIQAHHRYRFSKKTEFCSK